MIDWARLTGLRTDIGEEDFADVAVVFVTEIQEHLDRLQNAPDAAVAADFHFLRGSASNLGFEAMVDACQAAEAACNAGDAPDIEAVVTAFRGSVAAIAPEIPGLDTAA